MTESNTASEPGNESESSPRETTQDGQQSIQPFRLVKYFSFTGFFVILVFTFILSLFISQQAKNMLLKQSEDYARLVAENLNHQVFLQFILPMAQIYGRIRLREEVQFRQLDAVIRSTIHGFNVEKVNVYDFDGMIIYSTDKKLIETKGQSSPSYRAAMDGKSTSTLIVQSGRFGGFDQTRSLQTFTPFRAEKAFVGSVGEVLAVFEIYQDLTEDYAEIIKFQYLSIAISLLFTLLLFAVLRQIVKRADSIIEERNNEWRTLQERLHQSEKLAALGQMVAAVSHEIRNPLGIISSTAELLRGKLKKYEPDNQLADVIVEESGRLAGIVTEFLDFARPQEPKITSLSLQEIIKKNLNFLAPEIDKKGITISQLYGGPASIQADPDLIYRALLNIFLNAIQATPNEGRISVNTTGRNGRKGDVAIVTISDTGTGIKPEDLKMIFNPFFTTKDKGSGLGLAIVKNIIQSHRGDIFIEPIEGGGTRVEIHLPVNQH